MLTIKQGTIGVHYRSARITGQIYDKKNKNSIVYKKKSNII